jgi:hypothetical protein
VNKKNGGCHGELEDSPCESESIDKKTLYGPASLTVHKENIEFQEERENTLVS